MSGNLRLPKKFEQLAADFDASEVRWRKRVGRKALVRLPRRTDRHGELGNAIYYLSYLAFRAGRFDRARHYFDLGEELLRRHQLDEDLEDYEREGYPERIDKAGWISGDWERFGRYVALTPAHFRNALVEGHINLYVDWAILGRRVGAELVLDDLEPAAERERQQIEDSVKPPVRELAQSLWVDDGLARAYFWLGEYEKCREISDRFLSSVEAWKEVERKPRHIQLGRLAPQRELASALRLLAGETEDEFRSPAATRHVIQYLVSMRKEPAGYLFEAALILLIAVAAADREHPHAVGFLQAFPHLRHLLEWRQ